MIVSLVIAPLQTVLEQAETKGFTNRSQTLIVYNFNWGSFFIVLSKHDGYSLLFWIGTEFWF